MSRRTQNILIALAAVAALLLTAAYSQPDCDGRCVQPTRVEVAR